MTAFMMLQSLTRGRGGGAPNTLDAAGPAALSIARLATGLVIAAAIVFLVVLVLLVWPVLRSGETNRDLLDDRHMETRWILMGGVVVPVLLFAGILAISYAAMRSNTQPSSAYQVDVIGHQWWWEVRYPTAGFTTANEIHIPVGVPVRVHVSTGDVIHSFWVPQLQGKTDAITGRVNETWLQADHPGVYRGECAEFCGHEHAHMAFVVIANTPGEYAAWLANEQRLAVVPTDSSALMGQQTFLTQSCSYCHTIRGTGAGARVGPDLTHLASRHTLASGTIDFTRGNLAAWIENPDRIKPGTTMPPVQLDGATLGALVAYLESLR
jgi:cytochrome c oxidase subunit 2